MYTSSPVGYVVKGIAHSSRIFGYRVNSSICSRRRFQLPVDGRRVRPFPRSFIADGRSTETGWWVLVFHVRVFSPHRTARKMVTKKNKTAVPNNAEADEHPPFWKSNGRENLPRRATESGIRSPYRVTCWARDCARSTSNPNGFGSAGSDGCVRRDPFFFVFESNAVRPTASRPRESARANDAYFHARRISIQRPRAPARYIRIVAGFLTIHARSPLRPRIIII